MGDNIASLKAYTYVRGRDGSLATAHSLKHISWSFDLQLNEKLNHRSSQLVFRHGFEHLVEKVISGIERNESTIEYDDEDSSRKVKELAGFMKEHPWHFFTLTHLAIGRLHL